MSNVSELLISLTKNERPWAIRSGRSEEMSDVSKSLISLTKNERMSELLIFWAKQMSEFPALEHIHFFQQNHSILEWTLSFFLKCYDYATFGDHPEITK